MKFCANTYIVLLKIFNASAKTMSRYGRQLLQPLLICSPPRKDTEDDSEDDDDKSISGDGEEKKPNWISAELLQWNTDGTAIACVFSDASVRISTVTLSI